MSNALQELIQKIKQEKDAVAKARIIHDVVATGSVTKAEMARQLGVTPAYISSILRLTKLSDLVIDGYYAGLITMSHLFVIGRLEGHGDQNELYEEIVKHQWPTTEADEFIRKKKYGIESYPHVVDAEDVRQLRKFFASIDPSFKVQVHQSRIRFFIKAELSGDRMRSYNAVKKLLKKLPLSDHKEE